MFCHGVVCENVTRGGSVTGLFGPLNIQGCREEVYL